MDGTRKYHPKWGNPITKEHTWYAPKNSLISGYIIPETWNTQDTIHISNDAQEGGRTKYESLDPL